MAPSVIAKDLKDVLDRVAAAALHGVRWAEEDLDMKPGFRALVTPNDPPVGEQCDSVVVWVDGFQPVPDPSECSIIWDAQIKVRLDWCAGVPEETEMTGKVSAKEQTDRAEKFNGLLWGMMAGLTSAWAGRVDPAIPYPADPSGCKKLTWGNVEPPVEEGGIIWAQVNLSVEISPRYEST